MTGAPVPLPIHDAHLQVLRLLVRRLPLAGVNWALTGSLGHRLQGVDVPVNDIDLQTDAAGADAVARALSDHVVEPPRWRESDRIASVFGMLVVDGVPVEVMGGLRKRPSPADPWGPPTDPAEHRLVVTMGELAVPVLSLEYEAAAYEALGRDRRAALLRAATIQEDQSGRP